MTMLVFASCMSALDNPEQPVWVEAAAHKPEWLVLGGDNIYMDYGVHLDQSRHWTPARFAQEMQLRYTRQFAVKTFRELVETIPAGQVIGVWDDHDFAWQNCFGADPSYGMHAMRISVSNWATSEQDVDLSAAAILRVAASRR